MRLLFSAFTSAVFVTVALTDLSGRARQQAAPQAEPQPALAFEAASVKPSRSATPAMTVDMPPGRFVMTNATLAFLIGAAFAMPASQIEGGPRWVRSDRFDVSAKADYERPRDEIQLMLRALLADRFGLGVHFEGRDTAIYALVLARDDGRLGPQLRPSTVDCAALQAERRRGGPVPPAVPGAAPLCGMQSSGGQMQASAMSLPTLAASLSGLARRPVRDRTGLAGGFDVDLQWTPEPGPPGAAGQAGGNAASGDNVSVFTAVQEQLGLRLEPDREAIDVLVIDRVTEPTPD